MIRLVFSQAHPGCYMNGDGTEAGDRQTWRPGWRPEKGGGGLCARSNSGDGVGTGLRETKVPEMTAGLGPVQSAHWGA